MNPLLFIDWHKVNQIVCAIAWVVVFILFVVIMVHLFPGYGAHPYTHPVPLR